MDSKQADIETRKSVSAAIVWREYEIEAGIIKRKGKHYTQRYYLPMASPGLVGEIAKLHPGDEKASVALAYKWGNLGYSRLAERTPARRSFPIGDPLVWLWAHAAGMRAVLKLRSLLQLRDDRGLSEYLEKCLVTDRMLDAREDVATLLREGKANETLEYTDALFSLQEEDCWPSPMLIYGERERIIGAGWPVRGDIRQAAHKIMADIINPNMVGVYRVLRLTEDSEALEIGRAWDSVLSAAYWHLGELVAGGRVEECEHCQNLFVQSRRDQRFCPAPPFISESSCASAARQRRKRKGG